MPTLLAIIPEDGRAMVREGEAIFFFVRPPFRSQERVPVPETALANAISLHGYEAQHNVPEEPWARVVERIREIMARVRENEHLSDNEFLVRMLRSGPPSVLTGLLDRIEGDWLAKGDLRAAEHALKALLSESRVKSSKALLDRALALRQGLDDLRDQREARAPAPSPPPRIVEIATRPGVAGFRSRFRGRGSASMVDAGV